MKEFKKSKTLPDNVENIFYNLIRYIEIGSHESVDLYASYYSDNWQEKRLDKHQEEFLYNIILNVYNDLKYDLYKIKKFKKSRKQ